MGASSLKSEADHRLFKFWIQISLLLLIGFSMIYLADKSKKFFSIGLLIVLINSKYLSPIGIVAMIDVGQGDSLFIQAPFHRKNTLIDTGGGCLWQRSLAATEK